MTLKRNTKKNLFVIGMLFIPVVHFIIFWVVVNFNSFVIAFQRVDSTGELYYTLQNFRDIPALFGKDGILRTSLVNTTVTWLFTAVFLLSWSFFLTYFLYKKIKLSGLWRTMLFMCTLLPAAAMASIFLYISLPEAPIGQFFALFNGGEPIDIFDAEYARYTVILYYFLTNFGGQFVLLSGAMARVPKECLESAHLDGAGMGTEMFKIILPLCWPTVSMILLTNLAGFFAATGPVLLLTNGMKDTSTMSFYFFGETREGRLFVPAAVGLLCTAVLFPIVILVKWLLGKVYADVEF